MVEYRTVLERIEHRVRMPEPAFERLLRRRDRRARNQRIAAGVVGSGVAVAGIALAILALRGRDVTVPTAGPTPSPSSGDGLVGIVLPAIAVWVAFAVLGLVTVAMVRLRRVTTRPARHRTPGAPPAPGHGPEALARSADTEGGTMDSKEQIETRIPQLQAPRVGVDGRASRLNRWLVGAVGLLLVGIVVLGTALIVQANDEPVPAPEPMGLATTEVVQLLDAQRAALNATPPSEAAFLATFTPGAVITDTIADVETEATSYFEALGPAPTTGLGLVQTSEVIQNEQYAAVSFRLGDGTHGIVVFRLQDGKIDHQWILT